MTNRSLRILALGAALLAPALTGPSTASAQTTQGPAQSATADAAALARSRDMFQQANKLYDEGKYPQAEQLYLQAWKIKKSYDVAGNFGNLEADMNKPRAAAEYLSYALREFPAGGRPPLREALGKRLAEVSRMVGQLRITVNKPGADVLVDGQPAGSSPLAGEIYVDAGPHSVEARMEGFPPVIVNVTAQKGKSEQVALTFVPPPGASKVVIGVGAAVAGAGVIAGAVLLGIGASKGGTISDLQAKVKTTGCPTDQTMAWPAGAR
jgi:hypothetical protein